MKKIILIGLLLSITSFLFAQGINSIINVKEVERIERVLSSDEMQGRRVSTPGIEKAAIFIAAEFKTAGLQPLQRTDNYLQKFSMIRPKFISASGNFNHQPLDINQIIVITSSPDFSITENSGFEKVFINKGDTIFNAAMKYIGAGKNYLVIVDSSFKNNFSRLSFLKRQMFKTNTSVVFVLSNQNPETYSIEAKHEISETQMFNVAAVIPGKSKKDEYVIFSGHYDHLGIGKPDKNNDSIYNGANDDAAGTTAVITLAKYFKSLNNNERTLIFVAFTAEEVGGFGSQYFSKQLNPEKVVAMFNIEMIGTESKWGKNSAYITGFEKSNMGEILQKNLSGTDFTFSPDPYIGEHLFYRSDNATLAKLGVPAHTISTSKMDNEPNYHKQSDEIGTLDIPNMTEIIKAIAISSTSIVKGKDTPSRVVDTRQ